MASTQYAYATQMARCCACAEDNKAPVQRPRLRACAELRKHPGHVEVHHGAHPQRLPADLLKSQAGVPTLLAAAYATQLGHCQGFELAVCHYLSFS